MDFDRSSERATSIHASTHASTHARLERSIPLREPARARARPVRALRPGPLDPLAFEALLERERSLSDRGTRRLCLLRLCTRTEARGDPRTRDALSTLVHRACARLRATDIVSRQDPERIELLLTDTEAAGAAVVAAWVRNAETELGIDLEHALYAYPSPSEGAPRVRADEARGAALAPSHESEPVRPRSGLHDDPRATRAGSWLRRWSLDLRLLAQSLPSVLSGRGAR